MHFPPYWVRESATALAADGSTIERLAWGWSDESESDARITARKIALRAAEAACRGQLSGRYLYGERPLREPVLYELQASKRKCVGVVTRNALGCEVLNVEGVLFADIDINAGTMLIGALRRLFCNRRTQPGFPPAITDGINRVRRWLERHPNWNARVYQTRAGLRVVATHEIFDPCSSEVEGFFEAVGADPHYRRLCKVQRSFRARLTPKPWRCGTTRPLKQWPFSSREEEHEFDAWLESYTQCAERFAVCRLLENFEQSAVPAEVRAVIEYHDERVLGDSSLALA